MTGYQSKRAAAQDKLAHLTLEQRCRLSEQCLPEAPYREMLTKLHDEMLKALAQPEFIKHEVENSADWSEWVCPDPDDYLISCCDCGLVHQAQFRVAKYAPAPSEECEIVNDPDLQAQFRMRRSEQWSALDTAHRSGGLPMAQPEQEPVAWMSDHDVGFKKSEFGATPTVPLYTNPPQRPWVGLTDEEINDIAENYALTNPTTPLHFARAIEAAHGIKEGT